MEPRGMRAVARELFLVPSPAPIPVRLEARISGSQRVLFVIGERPHVLGAASASAVVELHDLGGTHVVLCIDRVPGHATARIRTWASRDRGASWAVDGSFDAGSLSPRTRIARAEPA